MQLIANDVGLNTIDQINWSLSALNVDLNIPISVENVKSEKKQNVRKDLLNELYQFYAQAQDEKNRKNYCRYIRVHHPAALAQKEEYYKYKDEYRKAKLPETVKYSPLIKKDSYVWWGRFSHLKGEDGNECLRTMISTVKDMINRKQSTIPYILGSAGKLSVDKSLA